MPFLFRFSLAVSKFVLKRLMCGSTALSGVMLVCMLFGSVASGQQQDAGRKQYSEKIASGYNYRFGKDLSFTPGNPEVQGGGFIQPGAFPDATYCAHCHQEAYHQWRQALHSNSFREPFYRTSVNLVNNTKGIEFSRHCDSCHNPIGVLSGALTENSQVDRKFDGNGVTCMVCHSIQGLKSTSGNGGFIMGVPSVMVDENGNRIPGEVPYDESLNHTDRHSRAVMQGFYRTPEFCAACHKANLPEHLNDYKFLSAFVTFDEWQNSKFSHRNPLTFYTGDFKTCQNCHMQRAPNTLPDYGAKHGTFASHSWAAGNTGVPFYYGFDEQLEKTLRFLQAQDYLNIDIFGIKKANEEKLIGPLGSVPFRIEPNDILDAYVVIQNKNIGHSLIPEVRDLYEAWVEFTVKDPQGKDIYHSGFLKPGGELNPRTHSFTSRPVDKDGKFVDNHQVQTIHSVAYDNTIQSGRSTLVRYRFRVPADIKGSITITAKVNYRHFRQSYINNVLGKDHPAYPVVELAARSRTLKIGDNPSVPPEPGDNPDWMRWNNLGIGYLDQLQYAAAAHAFSEVAHLRPDYADGYTNIALTETEWEKYKPARIAVEKALSLSPNNARALYYRALLERRAGESDAELADLEEVVQQYPQSRDARRELGVTYFQRDDDEHAIQQFQALEVIDPDDIAAHYNLSVLYRRMGMKKPAEQEQALLITEKADPEALTGSLKFLNNHPEISAESVPWHIHTDLPHDESPAAQSER
ncbi:MULTISPECIES: tetratricopeptide repeat protein [Acidobacteriaceae]|uniref:tetratricopeptide repeat protein n=1 Tax=Acidobacteriaceae TaxID=204434 RepID=UPI0020B10FCA|nr:MULTISPECIES: tetratricopeptide repeat protein [Acidobacteriaceae]MDW5266144.1 multiheme c-type cytochrome [Edaphobacter sp.]